MAVSEKRCCYQCREHLPPETEHIVYEDEVYCTSCVERVPYTAYYYELGGEWIGDEDSSDVEFIESYDDDYEEDED